MRSIKRGLALLLAVLLLVPETPVSAKEKSAPEIAEEVLFNTGNHVWSVVEKSIQESDSGNGTVSGNRSVSGNETVSGNEFVLEEMSGDAYFEEDGSYTINIPERNPFFPYEVQFTCNGEVTNQWFMTPDDSIEIGGHTFYVSADFDNTQVTQISFNVAGKKVVVYPAEKTFTNGDEMMPFSLLPLEEKYLSLDLTGFSPVELSMVTVDSILAGTDTLDETDKVMWKPAYDHWYGDFNINVSGDRIDLSSYAYGSNLIQLEMIVGALDQLAADNVRYLIDVQMTKANDWLIPVVYAQDSEGKRSQVAVQYSDWRSSSDSGDPWERGGELSICLPDEKQYYMTLKLNTSVFSDLSVDHVKVYRSSKAEAINGEDITEQIWNCDMTQSGNGFRISTIRNIVMLEQMILVAYDADNEVIGHQMLNINVDFYRVGTVTISALQTAKGERCVNEVDYSQLDDLDWECVLELYKGFSADDMYFLSMQYVKYMYEGFSADNMYYLSMEYIKNNNYYKPAFATHEVLAAYIGRYSSISEARAADAEDIKDYIFSQEVTKAYGYAADYSQGVDFTIFVGEDGSENQEVHHFRVQTKEGEVAKSNSLWFNGLADKNGNEIPAYTIASGDDSYAEANYPTILVGSDVDLTCLAPIFSVESGNRLYAAGSDTEEQSGISKHDFSKGPVQYTVLGENGETKNYWLQIVKATEGPGWLYINSLADKDAETRIENGITYSTREIMLDVSHNNLHDILLANMGTDAIPALSAELISDIVELDDYWTLSGDYDLAGFSTTEVKSGYGSLPNLAKIRIKAKDGVAAGTSISGTLTIKSGETVLMVLNLTGSVNAPYITTRELPQAVKYVPYGAVIQNSNKYSGTSMRYSLAEGNLPQGMELKENGEIYGMPAEAGEYTFTVCMCDNGGIYEDSFKTFTLKILDNTDENVEAATDPGYRLIERVQNIYLDALGTGSQTMVSQGAYEEFVALYLDGVILTDGKDYFSAPGSTRITILNQTLAKDGADSVGTHTLSMEFRTKETGILKRASQNYTISAISDKENSGNGNGNGSSGSSNGDAVTGDNGGNDGTTGTDSGKEKDSGNNISAEAYNVITGSATVIEYTIASGDSLWKIARKFYGAGELWRKIYEDNADVIRNPGRIYAGQRIKIYLTQKNDGTEDALKLQGASYTVKPGDNLWKIARSVYGNSIYWRKIYLANKEILPDPGRIYPGQVIIIPD